MPKPPTTDQGLEAQKKFRNLIIAPSSSSSKYSSKSRSPQVQCERSQPQASQLSLLTLLGKSLEPTLCIEPIPTNVTVGSSERFCLIHQESGLRMPGQFSQAEAEYILKATKQWDWEIRHQPRTPSCNRCLLSLLTAVCTPQKALGVAV